MSTETTTAAIIGERRAYQSLRLRDLGRRKQAAKLIAPFDDRDLVALAAGLMHVTGSVTARLDSGAREAAARRQVELRAMFAADKSLPALRAWVTAHADETLRLLRELWPKQTQRLHFLETMARTTFDAEEPGSVVRERYFGGTPAAAS